MAKRVSVDKILFAVTLLLVVAGLVMVFSASAVMAKERFGSASGFFFRQLGWAVAGVFAMVVLMRIDYRRYQHPAVVFTLVGITTLLLITVFFLDRSHNTHRWIHVGPFSLQPSELAKPTIIFFLAYFLADKSRSISDWRRTVLPAALPCLLMATLIVKQPDLGTAMACVFITATILFTAGLQMKYLWYAALAAVPILYLLVFRVGWRYKRMLAFWNPEADPKGAGFHIIQSLIAVASGGLSGAGFMEGKQKLFYLPEPHTDFIFAVLSEEMGLLGSLFVLALFGIFMYRGFRAALRCNDLFGRYLAVGITAMVGVQALFNISVVLGLLPTKGIPLPFISYGGTSLFIMLASVGVLLNITQHAE
jgi:cell division protein FtsW